MKNKGGVRMELREIRERLEGIRDFIINEYYDNGIMWVRHEILLGKIDSLIDDLGVNKGIIFKV